jgi:hypothetical protein
MITKHLNKFVTSRLLPVSRHYYRPVESDILEDYVIHAVDALTIDPKKRLEKENQELKNVQTQEIIKLKQGRRVHLVVPAYYIPNLGYIL